MSAQWQSGDPRTTFVPVATGKAVPAQGIAAALTSGTLTKASEQPYATSTTVTRQNFIANFMGMTAQQKLANALTYGNQGAGDIRVNCGGVHRVSIKSGSTLAINSLVGPTVITGSYSTNDLNVMKDDEFEVVSNLNESVGRIVGLPNGTSGLFADIEVLSTLNPSSK
jgi:hypothetical protein